MISGAILHSDRGSQYTSEAFRETLECMKLQQSLSGVAHCYDNARMESFFATLKKELLYRIPTYRMTMDDVKSAVFRYVFTYYNTMRIYTRNPYGWPPAVYRPNGVSPKFCVNSKSRCKIEQKLLFWGVSPLSTL